MFWPKIGNSVSDRLFCDSVIAENQCLYNGMVQASCPGQPLLAEMFSRTVHRFC